MRGGGVLGYALRWVLAGAAVVVLAVLLIDDGGTDDLAATAEQRRLPPVEQIELSAAARAAGCSLRQVTPARFTGAPPLRPGVYGVTLSPARISSTVRRGLIVLRHRIGAPPEVREALVQLHRVLPRGTVVGPNSRQSSIVVASAYRWALACPVFRRETIDALRLFRGRYVGRGPDG